MRPAADTQSVHPYRQVRASVGSYRHGKPRVQITMPQYIFDEIRKEALAKERSVNAVTIDWLEAAYGLAHEEDEGRPCS